MNSSNSPSSSAFVFGDRALASSVCTNLFESQTTDVFHHLKRVLLLMWTQILLFRSGNAVRHKKRIHLMGDLKEPLIPARNKSNRASARSPLLSFLLCASSHSSSLTVPMRTCLTHNTPAKKNRIYTAANSCPDRIADIYTTL